MVRTPPPFFFNPHNPRPLSTSISFATASASPKLGKIDDVTKTLGNSVVVMTVQIEIVDPDSDKWAFKVVQKGPQVMQSIELTDKGRLTYKLVPGKSGTAAVTVTATDSGGNSGTTAFTVTVHEKMDDRIHVTRCSRVQLAGAARGEVNGVYDRVPKFLNGWRVKYLSVYRTRTNMLKRWLHPPLHTFGLQMEYAL